MEKLSTEILAEIRSEIQSLRKRLEDLDAQVEALAAAAAAPAAMEPVLEDGPVDLSDAEIGVVDIDLPEPEPAPAPAEPAPAEPEVRPAPLPEPAPVSEAPAPSPEVVAPVPETPAPAPAVEEDMPFFAEEKPVPGPVAKPRKGRSAEDIAALRPAWKTDKPGAPVKNIRSAISLYDRALFIHTLFKEDFSLYDRTIGDLNAMTDLESAEAYVLEHFPDWNLSSDVVYSFMMSVRKKLG